jgi:hypothetical protein
MPALQRRTFLIPLRGPLPSILISMSPLMVYSLHWNQPSSDYPLPSPTSLLYTSRAIINPRSQRKSHYTWAVIVISPCPNTLTPTFIAFVLAILVLVKISSIQNLYSHFPFTSTIPFVSRPKTPSQLRGDTVYSGELIPFLCFLRSMKRE